MRLPIGAYLVLALTILFVGIAHAAEPRVDVQVKKDTAVSRALLTKEIAALQRVADKRNKERGCDLVAKICPVGVTFLDVDTYFALQIEDVLSRHVAEIAREDQRTACETWKTLLATDQDAIKNKLGGAPCD